MKYDEKINLLLGLPKSLFWNIKLFGLKKGLKLPVLLGWRCKVTIESGAIIEIPNNPPTGIIKIGVNCGPFNKGIGSKTLYIVKNGAKLIFKGKCNINQGSVLNVVSGSCVLGDNFAANANFLLSCEKNISIGDNVLFGWDCTVIDGDGHEIIDRQTNMVSNKATSISIGNHVWIAAQVSILKGAFLADNTVIGYGSLVTKQYVGQGIVVAGVPSRVVKTGIVWKR